MEKLYYRLCLGLDDIGNFYPIDQSPYEVVSNLDQEIYRSVYYYTESQVKDAETLVEILKKDGTKAKRKRGVGKCVLSNGTHLDTLPATTNRLIFDFDSDENPDNAKSDVLKLLEKLEHHKITAEDVEIYYSGNKGYHVIIETNQFFNSSELKSVCMSLAQGLVTIDTRVYNDARILRLPHSKHQKSGRYCTPVFVEDLVGNSEEIYKIATQKFDPSFDKIIVNLDSDIIEMKKNTVKSERKVITAIGDSFEAMKSAIHNIDFSKKWNNMPPAKWVLHEGFIPRGFGQEARMILAATYKSMMMCEEDAYRLLKSVSERRVKITGDQNSKFDTEEIWNNVINTVYSPLWQGGNYSINNELLKAIDSLLPAYLRYDRLSASAVTDKDEAFARFINYAQNVEKNTIKFGISSLDKNIRIMSKNVYSILGPPGVGKTSIVLQIMENTSNDKNKTTYFSFDMSLDDTLAKIFVRHTGKDEELVLKELKEGNPEVVAEYKKILETHYKNVDFVFRPSMKIEDMEREIVQQEQNTGIATKLVIVDYLTLIKSDAKDANSKTEEAIQGLRYLAHSLNCAVVVLVQPNKEYTHPDKPIKSYNGIKGSSAVSEACTAIITAYREGFDPTSFEDDKYFTFICVKNRKGRLFSQDYHWDGKRGLIRELKNTEREELKELREKKKEKENSEKKSWGF